MRWQFRHWLIALILLNSPLMAQAQALAPSLHPQFVDGTGKVLSGGFLYTYQASTTTPQATYADPLGTIANPNPIPLDATGSPSNGSTQVQVWLLNQSYKICAYNSALVQQWCWDSVSAYQILSSLPFLTFNSVTVDPSSPSAGEIWYRSDLGCFRGYSAFADCFVTLTGIQTLTNKNLTAPTINGGSINSPTVTTLVLNGATTGTGIQGTDSKLLSVGTISGTLSAPLCLDAQGGATTSSCAPTNGAAAGCTAIGPVTITNNNATQTLLSCTIPANALSAGSLLSLDLVGLESTASGQTISVSASLGGGTACVSNPTTATIANNQPYYFFGKLAVLTAGAGGTANWSCGVTSASAGIAGPFGVVGAPTISVNTTIPNTLLIQVQMSVANAGNSFTAQLLKSVVY
jgi:hypothetical protein